MNKILVLTLILLTMTLGICKAETASFTSDADTWFRDGRTNGSTDYMWVHGSYNFVGYIRFDLSSLGGIDISEASISLTTYGGWVHDTINNARFGMVALNNVDGNTAQDWDESTLNYNNAGEEWDADLYFTASTSDGRVTNLDLDDGANVIEDVPDSYTGTVTVSGPDLVAFLQERANDGGLATFMVAMEASGKYTSYATKECETVEYWPTLNLTYEMRTKAYAPTPEDGATVTDALEELSWLNPTNPADPNTPVTSDVYFGTTVPDANLVGYGLTLEYDDIEETNRGSSSYS